MCPSKIYELKLRNIVHISRHNATRDLCEFLMDNLESFDATHSN
ncbi:MAG: hypothetical protein RR198_01415 [Oscillospiraceae bacterium]